MNPYFIFVCDLAIDFFLLESASEFSSRCYGLTVLQLLLLRTKQLFIRKQKKRHEKKYFNHIQKNH